MKRRNARYFEQTYEVLSRECAPNKPTTKTYAELVQIMQNRLKPVSSATVRRTKFRARLQKDDETGTEFAAELQKMALKCNFASKDQSITDQLIEGIKDNHLRKELLRKEDLKLDEAIKIIKADEAAEMKATKIELARNRDDEAEGINYFDKHRRSRGRNRSPNRQQQRTRSNIYIIAEITANHHSNTDEENINKRHRARITTGFQNVSVWKMRSYSATVFPSK